MDEHYEKAEELKLLADKIIETFSFSYHSLPEARRTVHTDSYSYTFDALSMCCYESNLSYDEWRSLGEILDKIYKPDKEEDKERIERASLFHYLTNGNNRYRNFCIEKTTRPDFILTYNKHTVGVEVVRLTTEYDQVLGRITKENLGKGRNIKQIKADAIIRHGLKAKTYQYYDIDGIRAIGTNTIDLNRKKSFLAELICKKYQKYRKDANEFDEFIILADAQQDCSVGVDHEYDVDDIYKLVIENEPNIKHMTVAVTWADVENSVRVKEYSGGGSQ